MLERSQRMLRRDDGEPNYFHPSRTQPFLITLFQAVMAFKRVCKMMKMRLRHLGKFHSKRKRTSVFQRIIDRSREFAEEAKVGKKILSAVELNPEVLSAPSSPSPLSRKSSMVNMAFTDSPNKASSEFHTNAIELKVSNFRRLHHFQGGRAEALEDKLDKMLAWKHRKSSWRRADQDPKENSAVSFFKNFSHAMLAEDFDDCAAPATAIEYLCGSAIYFGATIALQARHGGFLSFSPEEVKVSAHKVLNNCRLSIKKSEDLTNVGIVSYGDALWLQAGANYVLGATYGSLVDQKRQIQPALVSCKRQSMFKAQQYGRWIILNRDDPMGTLGKAVCHMDKIMLEQEWAFLASSSPYESSMYKSVSNSDEAMRTKVDLFQPTEECAWKVHLVALPSENGKSERLRQKFLQKAKKQIDYSEENRYKKSGHILTSLTDNLAPELKEDSFISSTLAHKRNPTREQEHLRELYRKMSAQGFETRLGTENFLAGVYGADSPIVTCHREVVKISSRSHNNSLPSPASQADMLGKQDSQSARDDLQRQYWSTAHMLLVPAQSWAQLPQSMVQFYHTDEEKKNKAAAVLQKWLRRALDRRFNCERVMKKIDRKARSRMEEKINERRRLILEHTANVELMMSTPTPSLTHPNAAVDSPQSTNPCGFQSRRLNSPSAPSSVARRSVRSSVTPVKVSKNIPARRSALHRQDTSLSSISSKDMGAENSEERAQLRRTIVHALASYFPVDATHAPALDLHVIKEANNILHPQLEVSNRSLCRPQTASVANRQPAGVGSSRPSSAGVAETASRVNKDLHRDRQRLMKTTHSEFGLPADVFDIPVNDAYRPDARVGLRFLKSMSKPGLFSGVEYKQRSSWTRK